MLGRKKIAVIGVVVVLAVIGVVIGVIVSRQSSDSASTSSSDSTASGSSSSATSSGSSTSKSKSKSTSKSTNSSSGSITSDPTSVTYSVAAFAIGDWGTTVTKSSCCTRTSTYTDYDIVAEDVVASLMNTQAGDMSLTPKCIISHGDNFYWDGIMGSSDMDTRFTTTFEDKYDGDNIKTIPWVNVLGNHDYGGADYICSDGSDPTECSSTTALVAGLKNKFSWQADYTSPNDDRWVLTDHFYVYTIEDSDSGVSIDIFNVDSGDADTHGALQVCCQCYGYSDGDDDSCNNVARGDDYCAGGDTDMYDECFAVFQNWSDDSRTQLAEKLASSTATWKIVNSHYSPYAHYAESGMTEWFDIINQSDIHVWLNGHTHGENHDYSSSLGVHFFDNGAGGGIQMESASGIPTYAEAYVENIWTYGGSEYGFFSLQASTDWLKIQYHTSDTDWTFGSSMSETTTGGVATKHCWYIPNDGTEGQECDSSSGSS